ncbi:MAG: alpha/beta hydrolase [Acidimicrobiales bacterium]
MAEPAPEPRSPLQSLQLLAAQEKAIGPGLRHLELYEMDGLLSLMWHGPAAAERVVLCCGGALGGLLGPAEGLFHDLGVSLAEQGIGVVRVSYRLPNRLDACVHDVLAAAELAARAGAQRFVTVGHSFGGAVALQAGVILGEHTAGVVTLATQSAGCEIGEELGPTPILLIHGDADQILPPMASEMVRLIVGHGELVILPGVDHRMAGAADELRERLGAWIPAQFAA